VGKIARCGRGAHVTRERDFAHAVTLSSTKRSALADFDGSRRIEAGERPHGSRRAPDVVEGRGVFVGRALLTMRADQQCSKTFRVETFSTEWP